MTAWRSGAELLKPKPMNKTCTFLFLLALSSLSGFAQLNWTTPVNYATPTTTSTDDAIWFGDFNNDSKTDMVVRHWFTDKLTLFLNNGDGTFNAASTITSNPSLNDLVLADFNNDTHLDIAVTNADWNASYDMLSIHLGNGNGTFQPMTSYSTYGTYKYKLDAGDITGDGYKDLVVSSAGWDGFSILVNNGDGTFSDGNHYASTHECGSIKLADFNGDTYLDVALGNGSSGWAKQIDVFFGNGDGTFNPTFTSYTTTNPPVLMVCDVDNQHGTDIVFYNPYIHSSYYLKNDGFGAFTQVLIKENYEVIAVCDWNNDSYMDFVAVGFDPIHNTTTGTYIIINDGSDTFAEPLLLDASYKGLVAKLDADAYFDFAYVNVAQQAVGVKLQIVTPPTGITQTTVGNMLIYPNPVRDILYINTGTSSETSKNYSVKIVNTLGQTMFENAINNQLLSVDVSTLSANGIYFVQLIDQNGEIREINKFIRE